jgi:hypothetical protein
MEFDGLDQAFGGQLSGSLVIVATATISGVTMPGAIV